MNLSEEALKIIQGAVAYARDKHYEYITPELILLKLCEETDFKEAFDKCGGDIKQLASNMEAYAEEYIARVDGDDAEFSEGSSMVLSFAGLSAANSGRDEIEIRHLVHAIWQLEESYAVFYMKQQGIGEVDLLREMAQEEKTAFFDETQYIDADWEEGSMQTCSLGQWKRYAPCLNETLKDINPLIGREAELERTIQILCRKDKNNPLHIGDPGVGKTAITYGLVMRINENKVPKPLAGSKIFMLDLGGMLAGTQYRGDFEKRIKSVLSEIEKEDKPILYIDEIHNLSGAGAVGEGSFDASNMLKPVNETGIRSG